ncbi:LysR family transcriptional regulator [Streptomyces beihaiensis]|uniref:LysR family transcriptional regulator n=1 Tax=Streptomyces beihaiensis TaxID=2984495 RepID=A0ABT3TZ35_9ACTN|nr:LysR family transcriptional regulator [Streptomyces beihaiensis]MCX3062314.1 LysR family transcriptional regulator [Streptomyces beihaiensis]
MELHAVRTFVAVADEGQIQVAAAQLGISQQAASKRVAALERELGVRLFLRTPRGTRLTLDGEAFLPHARELLVAAERAADSVRAGRRPLRVDVLGTQLITNWALQEFHRARPDVPLDVAMFKDGRSAVDAVRDGVVDAAFWGRDVPDDRLPRGVRSSRAVDEALVLATGPAHPLADAGSVTPADLAGHRIWIPGIVPGAAWAAYYEELADRFGLDIDPSGPNFGGSHMLRTVSASATVATFLGTHTLLSAPAGVEVRRIPVRRPTPVYPHSLLWRDDHPHPGLAALREFLDGLRAREAPGGGDGKGKGDGWVWLPSWHRSS